MRAVPRLLIGIFVLVGCSAPAHGPQLPTHARSEFCSLAQILPMRLAVDPASTPPVWGINVQSGQRIDLSWPAGFRLEQRAGDWYVIDDEGTAVAGAAHVITDAGGGVGGGVAEICSIGGRQYP
jgi:hypothetical protein